MTSSVKGRVWWLLMTGQGDPETASMGLWCQLNTHRLMASLWLLSAHSLPFCVRKGHQAPLLYSEFSGTWGSPAARRTF